MPPFRPSSLFLLAVAASAAYGIKTCNVLDHGGIADGKTDIGPAISKAYADCVSNGRTSNPADAVLLVPRGMYALKTSVEFTNEDHFTIQIDGELNLVFDPALAGSMFLFDHCNYVVWKGTGAIYGNGGQWRPNGDLKKHPSRPRLVRFQNCNNIDVSGVTLHNSPMFHVTVIGSNNVVHDMNIIADHVGETDGFDISGNNNYVHDVSVENGDECVTVKAPTDGFRVENIRCVYTGGCNIGSFGKDVSGVSVQNVYYKNVTQSGGSGGITLKSFPSASGLVKNATYADFTFTDVAYPIKIDDFWCPGETCPEATGDLIWEGITFKRITGTGDSSDRPIIQVHCMSSKCTGLVFEDVNLSKEKNAKATVSISNACGKGLSNLPSC